MINMASRYATLSHRATPFTSPHKLRAQHSMYDTHSDLLVQRQEEKESTSWVRDTFADWIPHKVQSLSLRISKSAENTVLSSLTHVDSIQIAFSPSAVGSPPKALCSLAETLGV